MEIMRPGIDGDQRDITQGGAKSPVEVFRPNFPRKKENEKVTEVVRNGFKTVVRVRLIYKG